MGREVANVRRSPRHGAPPGSRPRILRWVALVVLGLLLTFAAVSGRGGYRRSRGDPGDIARSSRVLRSVAGRGTRRQGERDLTRGSGSLARARNAGWERPGCPTGEALGLGGLRSDHVLATRLLRNSARNRTDVRKSGRSCGRPPPLIRLPRCRRRRYLGRWGGGTSDRASPP